MYVLANSGPKGRKFQFITGINSEYKYEHNYLPVARSVERFVFHDFNNNNNTFFKIVLFEDSLIFLYKLNCSNIETIKLSVTMPNFHNNFIDRFVHFDHWKSF